MHILNWIAFFCITQTGFNSFNNNNSNVKSSDSQQKPPNETLNSNAFSSDQHEQLKTKLINEQRRISNFGKNQVKITVQSDEEACVSSSNNVNDDKASEVAYNSHADKPIFKLKKDSSDEVGENEEVKELRKSSGTSKDSASAAVTVKKPIHELGVKKNSIMGPKPGQEVLTLISTWIKNAPNDFMGRINN